MSQLIKRNSSHNIEKVFPQTFIHAIKDKETGISLNEILTGFNMYFVAYTGTKEETRKQVPNLIRREGLWLTYVDYDQTVVVEWYNKSEIDNYNWGLDSNWRVGNNYLVGDISITSDGNWVINGEVTGVKAQGEPGVTPLIRVADLNKLEVSYTEGKTWNILSDYIAAWFRFTGNTESSQTDNVGKIQISRDNGITWSDLSGEFTNSLHIKGYVVTIATLPSSAVQGDIYGVGPTYDSNDTEQTNPIYQLYVKDSTGWVNNGKFTSIAAGVVQTTGTSTTEVMSQKAVTDNLVLKANHGYDSNPKTLKEVDDKLGFKLDVEIAERDLATKEELGVLRELVVFLSEAEYVALEEKDDSKYYYVYEEE